MRASIKPGRFVLRALCAAGVAYVLAYFAHYNLDVSRQVLREQALVTAALVGVLVAIEVWLTRNDAQV